jgi:hypothetical protein
MGLERVVGDERVIEYDGASKLFLAGHEEMFRGHLTASPHYRTALALAAIGMPIRREKVEGPLCLE